MFITFLKFFSFIVIESHSRETIESIDFEPSRIRTIFITEIVYPRSDGSFLFCDNFISEIVLFVIA